MRSARMLLATAAATAALAVATPGAHAAGDDWDNEDSSYSKEQDKDSDQDSSYSKEQDKDSSDDSPRGGIHAGGGALTALSSDDWGSGSDSKQDSETSKDKDQDQDKDKDSGYGKDQDKDSGYDEEKDSGYGKDDGSDERDKPSGGMHTGGGALSAPGVTAGGLAVLGVAATGVYALRRKKAGEGVA
ncbi:hypothetical protein ABZY09_12295 [Streptomyces sp. NPDC002928]|uniref:hypothetical protein n=1 Tax=Streptomyces sp. NPDC002928 TaxID=3154440 RepID=UPI0033A2E9C4